MEAQDLSLLTEEHPLNAQSPYAASKIAADQLALSFHKSFDLPVSIIRPFNTYTKTIIKSNNTLNYHSIYR